MREYLSLQQAAATIPGRPHISTLHRWRQRGCRGVTLQTCLIGGRRFTTPEWISDFIDATTRSDGHVAPHREMPSRQCEATEPTRPPTLGSGDNRGTARIRRAEEQLRADGILPSRNVDL